MIQTDRYRGDYNQFYNANIISLLSFGFIALRYKELLLSLFWSYPNLRPLNKMMLD